MNDINWTPEGYKLFEEMVEKEFGEPIDKTKETVTRGLREFMEEGKVQPMTLDEFHKAIEEIWVDRIPEGRRVIMLDDRFFNLETLKLIDKLIREELENYEKAEENF